MNRSKEIWSYIALRIAFASKSCCQKHRAIRELCCWLVIGKNSSRQDFQSLRKSGVVVWHEEAEAIAPFVAYPALVTPTIGIYGKRVLMIKMKRAYPPVDTTIAVSVKCDVLANQTNNVGACTQKVNESVRGC